MNVAEGILLAAGAYAMLGVVVGIGFVVKGLGTVDHAAQGKGAPWHFRLMILPGAAALWPLMLVRWMRAARTSKEGST